MSTGLIEIMKSASKAQMENSQMCDLRFGTVISASPLKVQVTNQFTIPEALLIVPQHLTEHEMEITVDWSTEDAEEHSHDIKDKKKITIHNQLKVGDKVALIRKTGGQSYYILDRLV